MDRSRKENRESHEKTFQYKSPQEHSLDEELIEDKLAQLLASIDQLERTPAGAAGIQRRVKILGECKRSEGENFCGILLQAKALARLGHATEKVAVTSSETDRGRWN